MAVKSSQAAIDLIVAEEVSSKAAYQAKYTHPEWPGGASGVTIGIGYDCGYSTASTIQGDWGDKLPAAMVAALQHVAGIHGSPASSHAHELRGVVTVPWEAAMAVFIGRDMPKWEGIVERALPNTNLLSPDSFGAHHFRWPTTAARRSTMTATATARCARSRPSWGPATSTRSPASSAP
jgi:hypothetical protein